MTLEGYLLKFTLKPDKNFPVFSEEEATALFSEIKSLFFREKIRKWSSLKFSYEYVSSRGIDPEIFVRFLEHVMKSYFTLTNRKKGRTSAFGFVKALENSTIIKNSQQKAKWILPPGTDILAYLEAAKKYASFFVRGTHKKMIQHIHEEVNTGLSKETLKRYYSDQQK